MSLLYRFRRSSGE